MKLSFIWGPQEVGKDTISKTIAKYFNYRTIYAHNLMQMHSTLFHWVYGRFLKVEMDIYFEILDELLESDIPGIIITKVRYLNRKRDKKLVEAVLDKFRAKNIPIQEIELYADEDVRLERKKTEMRIQGKKAKRNITTSEKRLQKWYSSELQTNSPHAFGLVRENYLKIDTTNLTISETTQKIIDAFDPGSEV